MDLHSPVAKGGSPEQDLTLNASEFANHDRQQEDTTLGGSSAATFLSGSCP